MENVWHDASKCSHQTTAMCSDGIGVTCIRAAHCDDSSHIYEGFEFAHEYTEAMGGVRNTAHVLGGAAAAGLWYQTLCL